ncbi:unnamed protein product [Rhizophagus irregularis]|uniref:Uncharacterized protein n=1 Tax=Rhizophagus irregularis TaxID=588596 RepID=A0A915ZSN7_9GLOM|nr:unnamed protein product [Rhizophagus irregularis]CAB5388343.1 unnamed protein product [Rhizophagus irregularis]
MRKSAPRDAHAKTIVPILIIINIFDTNFFGYPGFHESHANQLLKSHYNCKKKKRIRISLTLNFDREIFTVRLFI